jgi:hypothetical protein
MYYNINKIVTISNKSSDNVPECLEFHDIILPDEDLPSKHIKKFKDGKLIFNYYSDMNIEMKVKTENVLKKRIDYINFKDFLAKVKNLTKNYRYFIQTDIIGAFYNFSFESIFNTLNDVIKDKNVCKYIFGFYIHIRDLYEKYEYLYISDYSRYIFTLFLQSIFKNKNIISMVDDIILYGDDMDELKKVFKEVSIILSNYKLYFNRDKTFYIDTFYDSIYIFKTIVSVPHCNILDNRIISKIKESVLKGEKIKVYELNDLIYNYIRILKSELEELLNNSNSVIRIEYYKNISLYKKIFYDIFEYLSISKTVNNNLRYVPLEKMLNTKKDIYYIEASESDDLYAYEEVYEYDYKKY